MAIETQDDRLLTLDRLFGSDLSIVIPDMQRDYCWGAVAPTPGSKGMDSVMIQNKAARFVQGLVHMMLKDTPAPLGLLYGYRSPLSTTHIMIIDGQQRLTTLFLLVGMLYRRISDPGLRRLLISDYELTDDREPRLIYQVRTEAMYFLSDLVTNFFLDRNGRLSQIEQSSWYYHTYASDQTVQNFINALRQIDTVLEDAALNPGWDWNAFAHMVAHKLQFFYHDLGDRTSAERMFITINTTGEPLTMPQHIKTMIVENSELSDELTDAMQQKWEEMESWGWQHRDRSRCDRPGTSDARVEQMILLWMACREMDASPEKAFRDLYAHFKAYAILVRLVPQALSRYANNAEDLLVVMPALAFIRKWNIHTGSKSVMVQCLRQLWSWLENLTRYIKPTLSGSDLRTMIDIVRRMASPDIIAMLALERQQYSKLLNPEEIAKLRLVAESGDRDSVLSLVDKAQQHPLFCGRISSLIGWCRQSDNTVDLNKMKLYINAVYTLWGERIESNPDLDDLRRSLLTLRHHKYPISRRGDTVLSLCWTEYEWQRLASTAPGLIRQILDNVLGSQRPAVDTLKRMAMKFKDASNPYYFLIRDAALLSECHDRTLLKPSAPFLGYYVDESADGASRPVYKRWFVEQLPLGIDPKVWRGVRQYGTRCLYTEHRGLDLAIDLYHISDKRYPYRLEMFSRKERPLDYRIDVKAIIESRGLKCSYDKKSKRWYIMLQDAAEAVAAFNSLAGMSQELLTFVS